MSNIFCILKIIVLIRAVSSKKKLFPLEPKQHRWPEGKYSLETACPNAIERKKKEGKKDRIILRSSMQAGLRGRYVYEKLFLMILKRQNYFLMILKRQIIIFGRPAGFAYENLSFSMFLKRGLSRLIVPTLRHNLRLEINTATVF
jgi:hypothetical protein